VFLQFGQTDALADIIVRQWGHLLLGSRNKATHQLKEPKTISRIIAHQPTNNHINQPKTPNWER
jgi:hypothetical protein